jgi:hypothetical protein
VSRLTDRRACLGHHGVGITHLFARATCLVLSVVALCAGGCTQHAGQIAVRAIDGGETLSLRSLSDEASSLAVGRVAAVRLAGAINEVVSFRFAVRWGGGSAGNVTIEPRPFTSAGGRIDASAVEVFRLEAVEVSRVPGWQMRILHPDAFVSHPLDVLVPVDGSSDTGPYTLNPGEDRAFWVDVAIPKGIASGNYSGGIEIQVGDGRAAALPVELTVWPFILPDAGDVTAIAEVDHEALVRSARGGMGKTMPGSAKAAGLPGVRDESVGLVHATMRMLQAHRLTPVLPDLSPVTKIGARGEVSIDWSRYDAIAAPCLDGEAFENRVPLARWPLPLGEVFTQTDSAGGLGSRTYGLIQRRYLEDCVRHFAERGWIGVSYAAVPASPPPTSTGAGATGDFASLVRSANSRVATVSRLWPQDMGPYGWVGYSAPDFAEGVDVWMPPAQFFDVDAMAAERRAGRRTWLAVDRPPFSGTTQVQARAADVRVLSWQAARLGCDVYHVGRVNGWPESEQALTADRCLEHDASTLLFPGARYGVDEPVASVRLKYLRQSQQDAAYRNLLIEHGLQHIPEALSKALVGHAGSEAYRTHFGDGRRPAWAGDPAMYELARKIMAGELLYALRTRLPAETARPPRTATWRRFMLGTRALRFDIDGLRFRLSGTQTDWEGHLDGVVTLTNRRRVPVEGTIRLTDLPAGWTMNTEATEVPTIPPDSTRRVTLTADVSSMPATPTGHVPFSFEFRSDEGHVHHRNLRVACIAARPLTGPIRIDGDLSDWPAGSGNVAAGFLPIASGDGGHSPEETGHLGRRTMAFVMRDDSNLYVAVNAAYDGGLPLDAGRRNSVAYDDMIPVGEELVELLIDPLNSGTRSPTDLYHIVVKPSGIYLTERGIAFDPPCARRELWLAEVEIATGTLAGRWVAELRVPLAAFGDLPTEHTVWGFNVARFELNRRMFSTWSGAKSNAYDPLSLGNLYLP